MKLRNIVIVSRDEACQLIRGIPVRDLTVIDKGRWEVDGKCRYRDTIVEREGVMYMLQATMTDADDIWFFDPGTDDWDWKEGPDVTLLQCESVQTTTSEWKVVD